MNVIETDSLTKYYGKNRGITDVNITVKQGDFTGFVGPNGSGGSLIGEALASGADIYITADLKYNDFMRHENRIILADMGHFESEYCAIQILFDILSKKLCIFAVRKSVCSRNPVNYMTR